jgi:NADPH:quinone reductase-like Zn-dependent oxidoreductase
MELLRNPGMRAAVFDSFGEPAEVLAVRDVPPPDLLPGTVRVRMIASPINPSDLMTVRGSYGKKPSLPAVPGYEGVGVVEDANAGLFGTFLRGKRVAVLNASGGNWQESVVLPAKQVVPVDAKLTDDQAATFFVNPAAAFVMTRRILNVPKGGWLLQSAAGSALGKMVIRLGKRFEFHTINIVRRAEQVEELKQLGADEVVVFDGSPPVATGGRLDPALDLAAQVKSLCGDDGVRYAIDPVGGKTASAMVNCLGTHGRMLLYGTLSGEPLSFSPRSLMTVGASVEGFWLSKHIHTLGLLGKINLMRTIGGLIHAGVLTSDIGETFPLERVLDAVRAAEAPGKPGKVLLRIGA